MADFDDDEEYDSFDLSRDDDRADTDDAAAGDQDDADDDLDDDYDDDFIDDALADDIDLVIGAYREDGQPVAVAMNLDLANDLDELINQLRRQPADAGVIGFVSLVEDVFVIVRVRGRNVQALLSDAGAANDWPIARDVADFLGEDPPEDDEDDDSAPMGDIGILADLGVREEEMELICEDFDSSSTELLMRIADRIGMGAAFNRALESFE
ncbi:tRNA adenosine deaminase-associated protein [Granulicoccus phenolivorans]|uniref:tRNA adenosine deaminase-associated protein n=1 Tax=Granulicoccus phenolivorans TaxID=266854 RepID=UPI0003FF7D5F|nr:tRNA adenosine deaminase-associated protein [Granulicoccus phenolivorans]